MRKGVPALVAVLLAAVAYAERPPAMHPGAAPGAEPASPPVPRDTFTAVVRRVVDGDTFVADVGSHRYRVRLIGVDTPETVRPKTPVQCYGPQASSYVHGLLTGVTIRAAYEPGGREDRYHRQLWDVWLPDGRFLAGVLAGDGYARAYPFYPQVRYASLLRMAADGARSAGRGLWGPPCFGNSFG